MTQVAVVVNIPTDPDQMRYTLEMLLKEAKGHGGFLDIRYDDYNPEIAAWAKEHETDPTIIT